MNNIKFVWWKINIFHNENWDIFNLSIAFDTIKNYVDEKWLVHISIVPKKDQSKWTHFMCINEFFYKDKWPIKTPKKDEFSDTELPF